MRWGHLCDRTKLHPRVLSAVLATAAELEAMPRPIIIEGVSGRRDKVEQNAAYMQSRDGSGRPWATNARWPHSEHNYGLAIDICPMDDKGQCIWTTHYTVGPLKGQMIPEWATMVRSLKAQGLKWGGDWTHVKGDFDHFYLGPDSPTPVMCACLQEAGIDTLWKRFDEGEIA